MYQVLYRKYRPQVFSDIVGQEHVTSTLSNELKEGKISHAYLFNGSRGTGKTTCARILAKAVNCLNPQNGNPCNECEMCRGIDNSSILDVIEIDAASNRGVDNIRDLTDEANFTPANAKYRVYIIDEVHMLTIEAFNALLKTLEEPPEHVKFILATTEVHKLPPTILSRCQRFDFRRIPVEDIVKRLKFVCEQEGLSIDDSAAALVASIADGALRDALSLLDQCASRSKNITADVVESAAGMAGKNYLYDLADALNSKDTSTVFQMIDDLHNASCDMERLCSELISHFRNLMVVKTVKKAEGLIVCTQEELKKIAEQSQKFTLENILYCLSQLENTLSNIKRGLSGRIETEMAMVRICSPKLDETNKALLSRVAELELKLSALSQGQVISAPVVQKAEDPKPEIKKPSLPIEDSFTPPPPEEDEFVPPMPVAPAEKPKPVENTAPVQQVKPAPAQEEPASPDEDRPFALWAETLAILGETDKPLRGLLAGSSAVLRGDFVLINSFNPTLDQFIRIDTHRRALSEAIYKATGRKYRLGIFKGETKQEMPSAKKDPLEDFLKKANANNIPFDIN
ncbi:MAG: DNA polymerase III subunit gamma/tau [Ruminococcaceae bacterium]|nr:DNA polymerase III subunit gamma/tau [Oscillospiraceae bacterium]